MEKISILDRIRIKALGQSLVTWRNVSFFLITLILLTVLVQQVLNLLNGDYSRAESRLESVATAVDSLLAEAVENGQAAIIAIGTKIGNSLDGPQVVSAETSYIAPLAQWSVIDSSGGTVNTWQMPEYTAEVMANPSLHEPKIERVSGDDQDRAISQGYEQKEYATLETYVLNTQEVWNTVWLDVTNSSHTDYDERGDPILKEFYEWRIGVWGTPYSFELHDSETEGHALLTWVDANNVNHVELVPLGAFIKIAYGSGSIYFYQDQKGLPIFTYPTSGAPIFQVEFVMMEGQFDAIIVDSENQVPYVLLEDLPDSDNWTLHRNWTQPIRCPLFLDENTVCTSLLP